MNYVIYFVHQSVGDALIKIIESGGCQNRKFVLGTKLECLGLAIRIRNPPNFWPILESVPESVF